MALRGQLKCMWTEDILTGNDRNLELVQLVQWGGYMSRINKYQGSLIKKEIVSNRFERKDTTDVNKWQDLRYLWD